MRKLLALVALVPLWACSQAPAGNGGGDDDGGGGPDGGTPQGDGSVPRGPYLIAAPGAAGYDGALSDRALAYDRQFHAFNAPWGLSLDAMIPDTGDRAQVAAFLAQHGTDDFASFAGKPVAQIVESYDEHGDLGMFAGAAAAGEAFRYIALRDANADVTAARAQLVAAIDAFHIAATIVGEPGAVARGIKRLDEPGAAPAVTSPPGSCPQAGDRGDTWRPDGSGQHPGWIYRDDNSKDQIIGYAFALGAFWDAIATDPAIPQRVRDQVQKDARDLAHALMRTVTVGFQSADLIVTDWHGCPTKHMDLNPRVVPVGGGDPIVLPQSSTTQNGWNALAALGVMRTLYHVAGDTDIGRYYYAELVGNRDFPTLVTSGPAHAGAMYQDGCNGSCAETNFSNVNMAFVAAYGVLRYESDPTLHARYEAILESELWNTGRHHDGKAIQQAFFNLVESAFRTGGNDAAVTASAVAQLHEFPAPPYWDASVENCDAGELAAGACTAIDGTTQIQLEAPNKATAVLPLPKRLRPPSNFEWRSDPRSVNGGGGTKLDPGGDFRAAYWMGRVLLAAPHGIDNVSPVARPRVQ
jgi:hypothetical protein